MNMKSLSRIAFSVDVVVIAMTGFQASALAQPRRSVSSSVSSVNAVRSVTIPVKHDVSPPLRDIPAVPPEAGAPREIPILPTEFVPNVAGEADPVLQTSLLDSLAVIEGLNIDGLGRGAYGFHVGAAPPDTNGAVGDTQYMQWVNSSFAVFDKATGDLLLGPAQGVTLFAGFGGPCETKNGGDGVILYDKIAGRWVFTQINNARLACIALSTSSDATDTYYRYSFDLSDLPPSTTLSDYPKITVWPDAIYYTANIFGGGFLGVNFCAFDRNRMLTGDDATAVCFFTNTVGGSYLPADFDGTTLPPDGSPNFLVSLSGTSALNLIKFVVDFDNPGNSGLIGPVRIPVAPFRRPTQNVPQLGTTQTLATLGDRLMFRLAYRNFGDHESLVLNHSVAAGDGGTNSIGVRWYELRNPNDDNPIVFQQGTYSPDNTFRWMGSIAMDQAGNIAVGYSASSSDINPAIRYAGRESDDPLGLLRAENSFIEGTGSQLPNLGRWGDYSSITVDPNDDCTFWYTTEYLQADGTFNWNTKIASFRFVSCGSVWPQPSSPE